MIGRISRALLVGTLLCAVVALFVPSKAMAMRTAKPSCCSSMKAQMEDAVRCPMHPKAPEKKPDDAACCQGCALALALLFVVAPDFVYASTGEESLVSLNDCGNSLPHRPPVPPPRVAFA